MTSQLFYLQDSRDYVGNDVLWWCPDGKGYTTDLSKAAVFDQAGAQAQHNSRATDIPWPKEYIDGKTRPAVDMQYIHIKAALANTGITLQKPRKPRQSTLQCHGCGVFMSTIQQYSANCHICGADNRP